MVTTERKTMSTIRKHRKKWQVLIRRKDHPQVSKCFVSKEAAREWARETEVNIEKGLYANLTEAHKTTLGELLEQYRDNVSSRKKGFDSERHRINKLCRHKICHSTLSKLTKLRVLKFRDEWVTTHNPSTCNKYVSLISMALSYAMDDLDIYLPHNVCRNIKRLKEPEYKGEIIKPYEEDLLLKFAANSKAHWLRAAIIMGIDNGLRRSEILNLNVENIDYKKRTAKLVETKNGSTRNVGLTVRSVDELQKLPASIDGKIFTCRSVDQFKFYWKQLKRWTGVNKTFHSTRATFVTRAAENNWQVLDIAAQTGHKDIKVLAKHYSKLNAQYLSKKLTKKLELMAEKVEHIYNGKKIN